MIAAVVEQRWQAKQFECPSGPVEVLLHLGTGWVLCPVPRGWIGSHSLTGTIVREHVSRVDKATGVRTVVASIPRVWEDKTKAMLYLERLCPDCYDTDAAVCESCGGTGWLSAKADR